MPNKTEMTSLSSITITWSREDIHSYRYEEGLSEWTDAQAEEYLGLINHILTERSITVGWSVIEDKMRENENEK